MQRRGFLNGMALGIVATLSPSNVLFGNTKSPNTTHPIHAKFYQDSAYPPSLLGLRGSDNASYASAHLLRDGKKFELENIPVSEEYDLVVVGSGISGLSAACLYKEKHQNARILILDNHDDFGGHARRNEFIFEYNGTHYKILSYGGSESLQSPKSLYSKEVVDFLERFGLGIDNLAKGFDVGFYQRKGLKRGVYFDKTIFGEHKIIVGNPSKMVSDDVPPELHNTISFKDFVNQFPLSAQDKKLLRQLFESPKDYLAKLTKAQKQTYLEKTSYLEFLETKVGLSKQALKYFDGISDDFSALGIDAISCEEARESFLPGFSNLGLDDEDLVYGDLYIHHAPDGNATIARLLVKYLIPQVAPNAKQNLNDIILAQFDYSKLDPANISKHFTPTSEHNVRLRLKSTAIHVIDSQNSAQVCYIKDNALHKVQAKKVIMANYNSMIPYIIPSLPQAQKEALSQNVKTPLLYARVILRDWQSFMKLGVYDFYAPSMPFVRVSLDYPVNLGGYHHPINPNQPICINMICSPVALARRNMDLRGMNARDQARVARHLLHDMSFASIEEMMRSQLQAMLGNYGFKQDDILAITLNRWAHCYSYSFNPLFDDKDEFERTMTLARKPFGNIAIANSDSGYGAYIHTAIEQAMRAVQEIS
ncbi:NAD(P)-binding protein [Helicobacter fennelliae]